MRYLSVCSGIEAATSAWHHLGWEPVAFSEIEPFSSAVLKHHYPNVPNWGDMTQYQTWPDAAINVLVGGTPCQSFSIAGLRKGLEDPRGNLMLTFLGIAQRYRPRYIVWENVPGVLSSNEGRDFGTFLAALGELGYGWAYRVLDAQWFGVAQRRRRVFVVGCLGDQRRAAQVLFECESVRRDTAPSRAKGQGAAKSAAFSAGNSSNARSIGYIEEGAPPLRSGASGTNQVPTCITQPSPHAFKVRGGCDGGGKGYLGSDDTAFTVATHQDQHIAQAVTFVDVGATLKGGSGARGYPDPSDGNGHNMVAQPVAFEHGSIARNAGPAGESDLAPTLRREMGDNQPAVRIAMQVRRLTPVECERLQGFPDNHTNIPWRGKAEAPDGPRYKALGNSMAVPVMRWIGERINA